MTKSSRKKLAIVGGISATVLGLGVLALVLLKNNPERRVAQHLTKAQIFKRTGELDKAGAEIEAALAILPKDAGIMAKLARNLAARGELARADALFRKSIETNPDDLEAGFDAYDVMVSRGALDDAAKLLEKLDKQAQVAAPEAFRDRVLAGRADLALRRGDRAKAITALRSALQMNPALDAPIRLELAKVLAQEGDLAEAEQLARSLWDVRRPKDLAAPKNDQEKITQDVRFCADPVAARAGLVLGTFLVRRGAVDEGVRVLGEAAVRDPADVDVAIALATAEIARRRFDAALEVAKTLDQKKAPAAAAMVRGRVALAKNDKEAARKAFNEAASCAPGVAGPALAAAQCALDANDKEAAKKLVLSIDTNRCSLDDKVARCRALELVGEKDRARRELGDVLASSPGDPAAIDLLVRSCMEDGKPELAAKELDALEKRSPGNRTIQRARTMLALWTQNTTEAVKLSEESVASGTDSSSLPILTAALAIDGGVGAAVKELSKLAESASDEPTKIRARLQAAELYRALGRGDLAVPILEQGVAEHPLTKDLRLALARILLVLHRPEDARKALAPLLDGTPDPTAVLLAASAAQQESRFDAAIALAKRIEGDPVRGAEAVAVIALSSRAKGDLDGARAAFERLRELRPSAALGYVGALCDLEAQPAGTAATLRKACDLLGHDAFSVDLAVALDLAGDDDCVKVAKSAVEHAKKDAGAAYVYAAACLRRGHGDEASAALLDAGVPADLRLSLAALDKDSLGSFEELLALRRHGFDKEAVQVARRLAAKAGDNLVVALHVARAFAATNDLALAKKVLAKAVSTAPKFAPGRLELGFLLQKMPDGKKGALDAFEEGVALAPENADLQLARGMALSQLGRAADAEQAYRKVLALEPHNAIARNNLAWLLLEAKKLDEALTLAEGAVRDAPSSSAALDTLARIQLAKGDAKGAVATAKKAADLAPLDAGIRLGFAKALDALDRKRDAANQYEVSLLLAASFEGRQEAEKRLAQLRAKAE